MKNWISLMAGAALLVGISGLALAFNPNQTELRYFAHIPDENMPTIDGVLSEGEYDWVPERSVYRLSDCWGADPNAGPCARAGDKHAGINDFDVPFCFLGWNKTENVIVWAVQVVDDVFYADQDYYKTFRGNDSIYWYCDADGNGGQYQYYDPPRTGVDGQQGLFRWDKDPEGRSHLGTYGTCDELQWAFKPPYTHIGITHDPITGSGTVEVKMQIWDWMENESTGGAGASTLHQLREGEIIGWRFEILDVDSYVPRWWPERTGDDWASLTFNPKRSPGINNAYTADDFAQWKLLSAEETGVGVTSVEAQDAVNLPASFALSQNTPNPFNAQTTIRYDLPETGEVRLCLYNLCGQLIRTLVDGHRPAGSYSVAWDGKDDTGRDVASGVYLYRIQTDAGTITRKMMMLR